MSIRRVALFEFMPYGAPELLESSAPFLARAVLAGALVWSATFAVLAASGLLRAVPVPIERHQTVFEFTRPLAQFESKAPSLARRPASTAGPKVPISPAAHPADPSAMPIAGAEDSPSGVLPQGLQGNDITEPVAPVIPQDERKYQQYEVEQLPEVLAAPRPVYPPFAQEAQVEGRVMVRVLVDRDGSVARLEIAQSIPMLDQAAIEAARNWKFAPARVGGRPVAVWVVIPFHFRLH